eukprot:CAMPEP_0204902964 /NCGR_PEP_ID=MMETSP1397-20131031/3980_1 /ASSEMBLY_ACC=CAM_ASM_000891 /TAXON_ID=49980 /ORGANISM="Climacostomum Climacostomum virens, Strain Stock W-24" /LENGTH=724 /DNA_ID=CAMNT_0052071541 /DNA_START=123 /DNA_END=2297 /DNA_ORIENTATION=+
MRLLTARLKPSTTDENVLASSIIKKADTPQQVQSLTEALTRFSNLKTLQNKWAILYLLNKLPAEAGISLPQSAYVPTSDGIDLEAKVPVKTIDLNYLLRDIIYAFQGIDGHYVTYSLLEDCFIIQPNLGVSDSIRKMVCELCELGWLYRRINEFTSSYLEDPGVGLVMQSLCNALQLELVEYYALLALIEEQQSNIQTGFSIKKLYLWCEEPLERLKWLAIISDSASGLKGGAVLSAVLSYAQHGNPRISTVIERVLKELSAPLLSMLKWWITEGELHDDFHEFFVAADFGVPDERLWVERYYINETMVPLHFDAALTNKALLVGKSINFLRRCCEIEEASNESYDAVDDFRNVAEWIEARAQVTNKKLIKVLFEKYRFKGHCESLKRYLLLAQGDLHQYLIETLIDELAEGAKRVYKHNLVSILESAIRASNAQFHDPEFLNRLDVKLASGGDADIGWDVFSLEYRVEQPLNTIFTAGVMEQYQSLFRFLWKIKRADFTLKTKSFKKIYSVLTLMNCEDIRPFLFECQLLQHEISHFVSNFLSYLLIEVVESTWLQFSKELATVADFDQLINCHSKYLTTLLDRAFLGPSTEAIYKQVLHLLDIALRFAQSSEALYTSCDEELSRRHNRKIEDFLDDSYDDDKTNRISYEALDDIHDLASNFAGSLKTFQGLLEESDRNHLKFLAFRLDFSEYYETMKQKQESMYGQREVLKSVRGLGPKLID